MRNVDFSSLKAQIEQLGHKKPKRTPPDPRFYNLTFPEGENRATAVIRFLLPKEGDPNFIVGVKDHWFEYETPMGKRKFYVNCPKTLNQKCPICDYAFNHKEDKSKMASEHFIANILVIRDPNNPDNEGKVFLFRFKRDVWKKIEQKITPEDPEIDPPVNIFDVENGANLKLVGVKKSVPGFSKLVTRYDESAWMQTGPIVIKGEKMSGDFLESLDEKVYSLAEFVAPEKFKSYEELQGLFDQAMNTLSEVPIDNAPAEKESAPTPAPEAPKTESNKFVSAPDTVGDDFFDTI